MFQFPAFASYTLFYSDEDTFLTILGNRTGPSLNRSDFPSIKGGLPHSEIVGSKGIRTSPTLIAAYHVLHRLCMPRHPLNALTTLDHSHCRCSFRTLAGQKSHQTTFRPRRDSTPTRPGKTSFTRSNQSRAVRLRKHMTVVWRTSAAYRRMTVSGSIFSLR